MLSNDSFWSASATNCITIGIAIFISYYLVQRKNDRRKQKDIICDLVLKLQAIIEQKDTYSLDGQTSEEILMRTRDISNRIHILETIKDEYCISTEVDFIRNKFDEYSAFIGDNINKKDYLSQSQTALKRPLDLMSDKLVALALKLYE